MNHELRTKPLGAGEGGRLPRGLSLFRFFLFSGLMLGAAYGGMALYLGSPPIPGFRVQEEAGAAAWSPSPWWLPVFVGLHAGIGVERTPDGYRFQGRSGHAFFGASAIAMGALLGGVVGWITGEQARQYVLRKYAARS